MRRALVAAAAAGALLGGAAPARAGWTAPVRVPAAEPMAVDARGDLATAWTTGTGGDRVAVRAAYLAAGAGRASVHTVLAPTARAVAGLTVALDDRGALTVAWADQAQRAGLRHGRVVLRAARRTERGRWSAVQAVARLKPLSAAEPRLAAAADGTVALTYNSGTRAVPGVAVAWARPGRPFGAPTAAGRFVGYLSAPGLAFDGHGRLHLYGTVSLCGRHVGGPCGLLLTAPGPRRPFGAPRGVAPAPATGLTLAFPAGAPFRAIAAWSRAIPADVRPLLGVPMAATVTADAVSAPIALDAGLAPPLSPVTVVPAPSGTAEAGWTSAAYPPPAGDLAATARIAPGPPPTATLAPPGDGRIATAADPFGDQARTTAFVLGVPAPMSVVARDARGTVEPAPLPAGPWATAVAAPRGRSLAAAVQQPGGWLVSVWRPGP